eukprot:TRINITY_DN26138_c0_g1_i1.p1 TRINITY_DN26138_c0_g1~~TRINITY_DN26138_c0_g1_i1.p1  ORF type:complete len:174 (-),score=51.19 TRINITY_DN26138_c0_g1_i1:22-492(-)
MFHSVIMNSQFWYQFVRRRIGSYAYNPQIHLDTSRVVHGNYKTIIRRFDLFMRRQFDEKSLDYEGTSNEVLWNTILEFLSVEQQSCVIFNWKNRAGKKEPVILLFLPEECDWREKISHYKIFPFKFNGLIKVIEIVKKIDFCEVQQKIDNYQDVIN